MLVGEVNTDIVECQKKEQFSYRKDSSVSSPSVWLHKCTTRVLLLYPVISQVKNLSPLLFLPFALHLHQILRYNLESCIFFLRSFLLGRQFLLLFPNLPPVSTYPSWLPGHQQQYLEFSAGQQQGHRQKGTSHPLRPHLCCSTAQKLCCPCQTAPRVSIQIKEHASHQLSQAHQVPWPTGKIRSGGYLWCLPSVPFPILLPKDTVGPISVPVKKLHLVPWGDENSD